MSAESSSLRPATRSRRYLRLRPVSTATASTVSGLSVHSPGCVTSAEMYGVRSNRPSDSVADKVSVTLQRSSELTSWVAAGVPAVEPSNGGDPLIGPILARCADRKPDSVGKQDGVFGDLARRLQILFNECR